MSKEGQTAAQRVFVNVPVPQQLFDYHGKPLQTFPPNGISTSKYTVLTFLPRNLFEQFRRVANLYFLGLNILQFFPRYSTINPFVSALPLVVIVGLTAVKDGFEDWRRHQSDEEINGSKTMCWNGKNVNAVFSNATTRGVWARIGDFGSKYRKKLEKRRSGKVVPGRKAGFNKPPVPDVAISWNAPDSDNAQSDPQWTETVWSSVVTGDLILLHNNDSIPADIIVLSTSEPDGLCYVETKNLDGETNLKIRRGIAETGYLSPAGTEDLKDFRCVVESEAPNNNLYTFLGALVLPPITEAEADVEKGDGNAHSTAIRIPLSVNNMLMRGCHLRNTDWAIGVAVHTGNATKIIMNAGKTPMKRSKTEKVMNLEVMINLAILLFICIVTCVVNPIWERNKEDMRPMWLDWTYTRGMNIGAAALDAFWMGIIIYQNVVPLSLYITLEIVKTFQAYFIYEDVDMYYEPIDQRCIPRSWAIADDLGQIDYVFSDKTGTLTRNVMEFKKFSVNGVVYGEGLTGGDKDMGTGAEDGVANTSTGNLKQTRPEDNRPPFWDNLLDIHLSEENTTQHAALSEFFTSLALCHSVLVSKDKSGAIAYKAQSPDEAALVNAAKDAGFIFLTRESTTMVCNLEGEEKGFELLNVIEFNSTRKRMSVIVRDRDGAIVLYCKGADSVIYERLAEGQDAYEEMTATHLEYFAEEGLRTLCIARRLIPEEEYNDWAREYQEASVSLVDRDTRMDAVAEAVEQNLTLIGATAIEDKLQEGVPECIATLMAAHIKVWVLTGDKMETAINIGFSCNLLTADMSLILIRGDADGDAAASVLAQMNEALETFFAEKATVPPATKQPSVVLNGDLEEGNVGDAHPTTASPSVDPPTDEANPSSGKYALIIDGAALLHGLIPPANVTLLQLATRCASVICCRVSPLQKAQVVELVKNNEHAMCLAIGDGANDVSMIQAAHIGVGIAGEEGLQAAMASDYAIAQFRFLSKLLLVHGRWSYRRTAEMILCFFFKNIVWVLVMFWYQFYCGFSAQSIYDFSYTLLYNMVFTSLPVVILGVLDQDISAHYILTAPPVYQSGTQWTFSLWRFGAYMLDAVYQSLVVLFVVLATFWEAATWENGQAPNLDVVGSTAAICAVFSANLIVAINTNSFTWLSWVVYTLSETAVVIWTLLYSYFPNSTMRGLIVQLFSSPQFWLTFVIVTFLCQFPRLGLNYLWRTLAPWDTAIVQEIAKYHLDKELYQVDSTRPDVHPAIMGAETEMEMAERKHGQPAAGGTDKAVDLEAMEQRATAMDEIPILRPDTEPEPPLAASPALQHPNLARVMSDSPSFVRSPIPDTRPNSPTFMSLPRNLSSAPPRLSTRFSIRSIRTEDPSTPCSPFRPPFTHHRTNSALSSRSRRNTGSSDMGSHLTLMRTGQVVPNRGFSFSQDPGASEVLAAHAGISSPVRRTSTDNGLRHYRSEGGLASSKEQTTHSQEMRWRSISDKQMDPAKRQERPSTAPGRIADTEKHADQG